MPLHDAYLRRTPYERFLPDREFPERRFPAIAEEAERRGVGLDDPGAFAVLEAASEALGELRRSDEPTETLSRHALMLFHAYHHHAAGTPAYLLATDVVRAATQREGWTVGEAGSGALPPSAYLQFPQHLVWARAEGDAPPASLDGAFRTATADGRVHVMAVGGLLGERPGFTVLPVPGAPAAHEAGWCSATMRPDGADFESRMPGAELEGLVEVCTAGEVLKLVARAASVIRAGSDGGFGGGAPTAPTPDGPPPSGLPSLRVVLNEAP